MQSLWMLVAAFLFSLMGVFVKLASAQHSPWEMLLWRNAIALVVLVPLVRQMSGGLRRGLATPHWPAHVVRNAAGTISVVLWFTSLAHLPLATSMTLNYTSSLFIGLMIFTTAAWAGQPLRNGPMLGALVAGFAGIVLVLRPTIAQDQLGWALTGLASGLLAGVALMSVRAMGRLGEPANRIVFYFTLSGFAAGLAGVLVTGFRVPDLRHAALLFGVGVSALGAQLAMTRAFATGKTLLAANLNYAGILFASLFGWLIWDDRVPGVAWAGMALIVASGIGATWLTATAEGKAAVPTPRSDA